MAKASKGRWRLTVVLCGLFGLSCVVLMSAVLWIYGTPYNPQWWWIMGAILMASFILPRVLVTPIEWIMMGYRDEPSE